MSDSENVRRIFDERLYEQALAEKDRFLLPVVRDELFDTFKKWWLQIPEDKLWLYHGQTDAKTVIDDFSRYIYVVPKETVGRYPNAIERDGKSIVTKLKLSWTEKFYKTDEWARKRAEILDRDDFKCRVCGKPVAEVELDVHHVNSLFYHPNLAFDR